MQMLGDVWEWTSSDFTAYPGFAAFPYPEYSEVFFGDEHKVLRGGAWATRRDVIRTSFRNWDLPMRRQIFAGIRCAAMNDVDRNADPNETIARARTPPSLPPTRHGPDHGPGQPASGRATLGHGGRRPRRA